MDEAEIMGRMLAVSPAVTIEATNEPTARRIVNGEAFLSIGDSLPPMIGGAASDHFARLLSALRAAMLSTPYAIGMRASMSGSGGIEIAIPTGAVDLQAIWRTAVDAAREAARNFTRGS